MNIAVYLPLLASAGLAFAAPWLAHRLPPVFGAWLLTVATVVTAAGSLWALALLAATELEELPPIETHVQLDAPVSDLVRLAALMLVAVGTGRAAVATRTRRRLERELRLACANHDPGELVVLADEVPQAFAVPGKPGHVVVSDGMLRALTASQRRVLLAHEGAHLDGHHERLLAMTEAAAAVNPLLRPARRAVAFLCERWADEVAARAVGDRRLAAQALATAALATAAVASGRAPSLGMAFERLGVVRRVEALQAPPQLRWRMATAAILLLCVAILSADIHATADFLELVAAALPH
jgi:Zn-dependent protease with chaperone function